MRLNHVANRIRKGNLDLILELFVSELGFRLLRRIPTDIWLRQSDSNVDIQFCETDAPICSHDKHNSHISFLTQTPEEDLKMLAAWFQQRGKVTRMGNWSEKEFWLDVPEVFIDFAIEAMTPDLAEYQVK